MGSCGDQASTRCRDSYELSLNENISLWELTRLMYSIGCHGFCGGWENAEPWYDMFFGSGDDVVDGYLSVDEYEQNLRTFLTEYAAPA